MNQAVIIHVFNESNIIFRALNAQNYFSFM